MHGSDRLCEYSIVDSQAVEDLIFVLNRKMSVIHRYSQLIEAKLIKRYKRFLCDVELESGQVVVSYLANPGSMLGMCVYGAQLRLSTHGTSSKRKHQYTVEAIKIGNVWIGCNTMLANKIVYQILTNRNVDIGNFDLLKPEWKSGSSRFDFAMFRDNKILKVVEVKTVTMSSDWFDVETSTMSAREKQRKIPSQRPDECRLKSVALFPDCESTRATRHLVHLANLGYDACLIYFVSRGDVHAVQPSKECDPDYFNTFNTLVGKGSIQAISLIVDFQVEMASDAKLVLLDVLYK